MVIVSPLPLMVIVSPLPLLVIVSFFNTFSVKTLNYIIIIINVLHVNKL